MWMPWQRGHRLDQVNEDPHSPTWTAMEGQTQAITRQSMCWSRGVQDSCGARWREAATLTLNNSGSHLVVYLVTRYPHYKVVILDKLDYCSSLENLKQVKDAKNCKFIKVGTQSGPLNLAQGRHPQHGPCKLHPGRRRHRYYHSRCCTNTRWYKIISCGLDNVTCDNRKLVR